MTPEEIKKIQKLSAAIENFRSCYVDCPLWGEQDGSVPFEGLMVWLSENPHMAKIALEIDKLN